MRCFIAKILNFGLTSNWDFLSGHSRDVVMSKNPLHYVFFIQKTLNFDKISNTVEKLRKKLIFKQYAFYCVKLTQSASNVTCERALLSHV